MKAPTNNTIPEFNRNNFTITKMVKEYSIYELSDLKNRILLSNVIKIETIYNDDPLSDIKKHLSFKSMTDWNISIKKIILFPSEVQGVYFGKFIKHHKISLLIARFTTEKKEGDNCPELSLIIHIFPNYYPRDEETLQDIITQ